MRLRKDKPLRFVQWGEGGRMEHPKPPTVTGIVGIYSAALVPTINGWIGKKVAANVQSGCMTSSIATKQNRVVYVLTSSGKDIYSAMTRLSIASIRLTNPEIHITIACDAETDHALNEANISWRGEADEWRVFETPPGEPMFRNRFIKTNLRNLLDGPFLYLDSDTIVRKSLSSLFKSDAVLAAACNHSMVQISDQVSEMDLQIIHRMKWPMKADHYINGGVLYWSDNKMARMLSAKWHALWMDSVRKEQCFKDQPALNTAITKQNVKVNLLESIYNAQIQCWPLLASAAYLWHYYAAYNDTGFPTIDDALRDISGAKHVDLNKIERLLECRVPWEPSFWTKGRGSALVQRSAQALISDLRQSGDVRKQLKELRQCDLRLCILTQQAAFAQSCGEGDRYVPRKLLASLVLDQISYSLGKGY